MHACIADLTQCQRRQVAVWLFVCCSLVFAMVVLGGVTRLTGSGLSIVEWEPLIGAVPPLSEHDWVELFQEYQQTPQYHKVNVNMTLEGFKGIFWLEYLHRLLGRGLGLVFLVPFLYFAVRNQITRDLVPKLVTMFVLGGMQGLLGWYMVKSGLVDNPHVSQYRLTAHLLAAIAIYGFMLWIGLNLWRPRGLAEEARWSPLRRITFVLGALLLLTITSGGLVAGLKAGLAYNTFPLMGDRLVPEGYGLLQPWWLNLFENIATVQFNHRLLASLTFIAVVSLWLFSRRYSLPGRIRLAFNLMAMMVLVQFALGVSTLLLYVPISLASAHQAGALMLFTIVVYTLHELRDE